MVRAFARAALTVARAAVAEGLVILADRIAPSEETDALTTEMRDFSGQTFSIRQDFRDHNPNVSLSPKAQAMVDDAMTPEPPPVAEEEGEPPLRGSLQWRERNG